MHERQGVEWCHTSFLTIEASTSDSDRPFSQLGVDPAGVRLTDLTLPAGHKVGQGQPLFPRADAGKK